MGLLKIIDSIISGGIKCKVEPSYFSDGHFTLAGEDDAKEISYRSLQEYTTQEISPYFDPFKRKPNALINYEMNYEKKAPMLIIGDFKRKKTVEMTYDKKDKILVLRIKKEDQSPLVIIKEGEKIGYSDTKLNNKIVRGIALEYERIFKKYQQRLNIKKYEKEAIKRTVKLHVIGF